MDSPQRPSFLHRIHTFFLPHEHNEYRPHVFRTTSVAVIIFAVLLLESAYLTQTRFVFPHTDFLASVLPGALVALTNDDRAASHLGSVSEDSVLAQAAQDAANDMATKGYFAHVSPDGKDPWYWLNLVGYSYQYAGENLAVNFTDSTDVENAWMASPSHHANIVKPEYTKVGIGVANGQYEGKDATFVVQFFATPAEPKMVVKPEVVQPSEHLPPAEVATTEATSAPSETLAVANVSEGAVLGTEAAPVAAPTSAQPLSFWEKIALSPTHVIVYILAALAAIVLLLLLAALFVKVRVQYLEIIGGGLFLLVVIILAILFNSTIAQTLKISTEAAAVVAQ